MNDIKEAKQILRRQLLALRSQLSDDYRRDADERIRRALENLEAYRQAKTLFCYVSVKEEVDTRSLLADAWAVGKRIAVPRCFPAKGSGRMEAREIASMDDLRPGLYGIPEPSDDCPIIPPEEIDLCVAPCLCVGGSGERLGYGGGYYDRYLPGLGPDALCVCLARERTQGAQVPIEVHDRPVDVLVTEEQVIFYENSK